MSHFKMGSTLNFEMGPGAGRDGTDERRAGDECGTVRKFGSLNGGSSVRFGHKERKKRGGRPRSPRGGNTEYWALEHDVGIDTFWTQSPQKCP